MSLPAKIKTLLHEPAAQASAELREFGLQARFVAAGSRDPSTKVGSILLKRSAQPVYYRYKMEDGSAGELFGSHYRVIGLGCNNLPPGVPEPEGIWLPENRALKLKLILCAEAAALLAAARVGEKTDGAILVSTHYPTAHDAVLICSAGVSAVYVDQAGFNDHSFDRWGDSWRDAREVFDGHNVPVYGLMLPLRANHPLLFDLIDQSERTGYVPQAD
ncbi:MAG: hypothetical protein AB7G06_02190 [Bdellovibrionales bacterium]